MEDRRFAVCKFPITLKASFCFLSANLILMTILLLLYHVNMSA